MLTHFSIFSHNLMDVTTSIQTVVPIPAISVDYTTSLSGLTYRWLQACSGGVCNTSKSNPAKFLVVNYLYRYKNQRFSRGPSATFTRLFTTNISFIDFNQTEYTITSRSNHSSPELMQPRPCSFITAESQNTLQPFGACTVFLAGYPPDCSKPKTQRLPSSFKNSSSCNRCFVRTGNTAKQSIFRSPCLGVSTTRAAKSVRPSQLVKVFSTCLIS